MRKMKPILKKKEHITIIVEPGSKHFCQIVPILRSLKGLVLYTVDHFDENGTHTSKFLQVGTTINKSCKNGAIKHIEMRIKRLTQ